jgi:hypothetical protein
LTILVAIRTSCPNWDKWLNNLAPLIDASCSVDIDKFLHQDNDRVFIVNNHTNFFKALILSCLFLASTVFAAWPHEDISQAVFAKSVKDRAPIDINNKYELVFF